MPRALQAAFVAADFCSIHFPLGPSLPYLNSRRSLSTFATDPSLAPSRSATRRAWRLELKILSITLSSEAPRARTFGRYFSLREPVENRGVARLQGFLECRRGDEGRLDMHGLSHPQSPSHAGHSQGEKGPGAQKNLGDGVACDCVRVREPPKPQLVWPKFARENASTDWCTELPTTWLT